MKLNEFKKYIFPTFIFIVLTILAYYGIGNILVFIFQLFNNKKPDDLFIAIIFSISFVGLFYYLYYKKEKEIKFLKDTIIVFLTCDKYLLRKYSSWQPEKYISISSYFRFGIRHNL